MRFHVLGIRRTQLQVLNTIVCGIAIYVVYALLACQLSSEMLFHDTAVLQDSLAIYKDSHAIIRSDAGLPFFAVCPIRGNVIRTVPKKATSMFLTNPSRCFVENCRATVHGTYLSLGHDDLLES